MDTKQLEKVEELNEIHSPGSLQEVSLASDDRELVPEYKDEFNPEGLYVALPSDRAKFRVINGKMKFVVYLIMIVEFAERGSYYGTIQVLTNFIMRPLPEGSTTGSTSTPNEAAGALDMGLQVANAFVTLLQFLAYVTPLLGGYLADAKLGKFKAIMIGVWIGLISHIVFVIAAIPTVISSGKALAPTVIAIISLAVGTGLIKPNLLPLLLDQFPYRTNVLKKLETGEIVYVDRDKSLERITMIFYWSINIGAFFSLATSYAARNVGYWLAYLAPGLLYLLVCLFMLLVGRYIQHPPPTGSILGKVGRVLTVSFRGNFIKRIRNKEFWEWSYPSNMESRGEIYYKNKKQIPISWTDQDVRDYKSTTLQCLMFLFWVVFNLSNAGLSAALNAQAGSMTTDDVPNDLFNNFNQLTIIILIPILDYIFYPTMEKLGIHIKSVHKISFGFLLGSLSSMTAALLQWRVYETSPCGYHATDCDLGVSPISAWQEVSVYILGAAGECFCYTQAYELAYTRAPSNAKGLVMALFLLTNAFSAAITQAISGALVDPNLIWPFAGISIAAFISTIVFLIKYWNLDKVMAKEALEREHALQEARLQDDEAGVVQRVKSHETKA